jgi:hypothetical protein
MQGKQVEKTSVNKKEKREGIQLWFAPLNLHDCHSHKLEKLGAQLLNKLHSIFSTAMG